MLLSSRLHGCGALLYTCMRLCACKHARVWWGWFFRQAFSDHLVHSLCCGTERSSTVFRELLVSGRAEWQWLPIELSHRGSHSERLMSGSRSLLVEVGACAGSGFPVPHQDLIPGSFQPSKITRSASFSSFKWCSFLQYKAKHLWTSIL